MYSNTFNLHLRLVFYIYIYYIWYGNRIKNEMWKDINFKMRIPMIMVIFGWMINLG